jgi:hypothetical protein
MPSRNNNSFLLQMRNGIQHSWQTINQSITQTHTHIKVSSKHFLIWQLRSTW